jgi:ATP-binding cassette subfamily F protein uup
MPLLQLENISLAHGPHPLLDNLELRIEKGERVCLLGRNGAGKTSLLQIIAGRLTPDAGKVLLPPWAGVGMLPQAVPSHLGGTVLEIVCAAGRQGKIGTRHRVTAETALSRLDIDPGLSFATLSAGRKRQVLFARALACDPDLLLLDEPTNHLDIPAIEKMELLLQRSPAAILFITHDRRFLQALATRILELDRGVLTCYDGGYDSYRKKKETAETNEKRRNTLFDKKLAQEEGWLRKGLKARRTRNEGRVRNLEKMRLERNARRQRAGKVRMEAQQAEASGKRVIEARHITFAWPGAGGKPVIDDFSATILRGEKVGLIGPNGIGKSTLIQLLLRQVSPNSGSVHHGTRLETVYFDQLRSQLDTEKSVAYNIGEGKEYIDINGRKRHVISYLKAFLFTAERARSPVRILSGGERNRLLLARLFTRAFNFLVMDEPTNDLDLETLQLLEELLRAYSGTLLLVSHDREFLDNVVTRSFVFTGDGCIHTIAGGYEGLKTQLADASPEKKPVAARQQRRATPKETKKPARLGYLQQRELAQLPDRIEALEKEREGLFDRMSRPEFYRQEGEGIAQAKARVTQLETELAAAYTRWEELETIGGS